MDSDAEMMERHGRLLARFADQAASLAEDLHACALAAATPEEKQALALAFHRTGRTLRQTLALEARLRRDQRREAQLAADRAEKAAKDRRQARQDKVRAAVEEIIWAQVEDDEQVSFLTRLEERLETEDLADPEEPIAAVVLRLAAEIGLSVPAPPPAQRPTAGPSAASPEAAPSERIDRDFWNSA